MVMIVSALMLIGMLWPSSAAGGFAGAWLPITETHQARAASALNVLRPATPLWDAAAQQTREELRIAPMRTAPWMRLAYIDAQRHGGHLTPAGVAAIQHGYDFAPYSNDVGVWRLAFVYDHWDEVTPEIRREALDETAVLWRVRARYGERGRFPEVISNDAGRLAVVLAIANIKSGAAP